MSSYADGYLDLCSVCSQANSKFYYGILTCDGCKAFFRRSILLKLEYECRYRKNCNIQSSRRNTCRACRFQKCLNVGMREDVVRKGRDPHPGTTKLRKEEPREGFDDERQWSSSMIELAMSSSGWSAVQSTHSTQKMLQQLLHDDSMLRRLSAAEMETYVRSNLSFYVAALKEIDEHSLEHSRRMRQLFSSSQQRSTAVTVGVAGLCQFLPATIPDAEKSFRDEFKSRIELLKQFQSFQELSLTDRVALFRANSVEFLLFSFLKRSEPFSDFLVLHDERHVITRVPLPTYSSGPNMGDAISSILDNVMRPFRELKIDSTELNCMRWISFWNPEVCSLEIKDAVKNRQLCMTILLEKYINALPVPSPGRLASLTLLLRIIQSVAQKMKETFRLIALLDVPQTDKLLDDIFKEPNHTYGPLAELLSRPVTFTVPSLRNIPENQFENKFENNYAMDSTSLEAVLTSSLDTSLFAAVAPWDPPPPPSESLDQRTMEL